MIQFGDFGEPEERVPESLTPIAPSTGPWRAAFLGAR